MTGDSVIFPPIMRQANRTNDNYNKYQQVRFSCTFQSQGLSKSPTFMRLLSMKEVLLRDKGQSR